jgi:hypothetical protein
MRLANLQLKSQVSPTSVHKKMVVVVAYVAEQAEYDPTERKPSLHKQMNNILKIKIIFNGSYHSFHLESNLQIARDSNPIMMN